MVKCWYLKLGGNTLKKLLWISALSALFLAACGDEKKEEPTVEVSKEEVTKEETKEPAETVEEAKIDTSVFKYAKSVEVTDARDTNKHITLQIDLNDDAQAGMGTQHVLTQMYDF